MNNHPKPLRRSDDAWIAGVIGGIAEYFDLDPSLCRAVYVFASILSAAFPGILIYVVLWVVIPRAEPRGDSQRDEGYWP